MPYNPRQKGVTMIIADNETDIDYLYYEPVAKTVVKLIREKTGEPLTIGLHGDWGAGKSSSLLMIEKAFAGEERTLCVRFNGWLFEGYEDAKAVLIETIVAQLLDKRPGITKVQDQAKKVLGSVNWFKVARSLGGAALSFATGLPNGDLLAGLGKVAQSVISDPSQVLTGDMLGKVFDGVADHFKAEGAADTAPQRMHTFREDFKKLLEEANIDRLVVLIDDLDRCLPKTAIATLEAIRLFLFIPRAAFVIAADEGMIEYAVGQHFPDLPASSGPNSYSRNYLEKLIQVPFRMPALGYLETRIYLALLLYLGIGADPKSDDFQKLLGVARGALKRPWERDVFTRKDIGEALTISGELDEALQVSAEITPILTDGARGNPRQVKRFVNTMNLRLAIAEERDFGEDLKPPVLAKLMLAERFAPDIFENIVRDSAGDGKSATVAALEAPAVQPSKAEGKTKTAQESKQEESPQVQWAQRWGEIKPKIADVDLRPYVFISRDRRTAFVNVLPEGLVEALIARLSGGTMVVKTTDPKDIATLSTGDAEKLFEGLVALVNATEDLSTDRPPAAEGLSFLTAHRPELQDALIAFIGRLPVKKLGAWAVSGWQEAFDDTHRVQLADILRQWGEQGENTKLRDIAKLQGSPRKTRGQG